MADCRRFSGLRVRYSGCPHAALAGPFSVLKEHQPLDLYFLPRLHFNLLTSCLCHIGGNSSIFLSARHWLLAHCAPYTVLVSVPSLSQCERDVRWAHSAPISPSHQIPALGALSLLGRSFAGQSFFGRTGH